MSVGSGRTKQRIELGRAKQGVWILILCEFPRYSPAHSRFSKTVHWFLIEIRLLVPPNANFTHDWSISLFLKYVDGI